jgi:hypothetical protein
MSISIPFLFKGQAVKRWRVNCLPLGLVVLLPFTSLAQFTTAFKKRKNYID